MKSNAASRARQRMRKAEHLKGSRRVARPGSADYAMSAQISVVVPVLLTTVKTPVLVSTV
jgi:hypothetical protein